MGGVVGSIVGSGVRSWGTTVDNIVGFAENRF